MQEGETEARAAVPGKGAGARRRTWRARNFFLAMVQKAGGDYDGALENLDDVRRQYPRDRVAIDQIGRILFLKRRYAEAVQAFQETLAVDPEDLQAHYNLMLCYRGLGQMAQAAREEQLFRRFKADEASQALTAQAAPFQPRGQQ